MEFLIILPGIVSLLPFAFSNQTHFVQRPSWVSIGFEPNYIVQPLPQSLSIPSGRLCAQVSIGTFLTKLYLYALDFVVPPLGAPFPIFLCGQCVKPLFQFTVELLYCLPFPGSFVRIVSPSLAFRLSN